MEELLIAERLWYISDVMAVQCRIFKSWLLFMDFGLLQTRERSCWMLFKSSVGFFLVNNNNNSNDNNNNHP